VELPVRAAVSRTTKRSSHGRLPALSELETDRATVPVVNLESLHWQSTVLVTMISTLEARRPGVAEFDMPAVKIMFRVTQIVRFLPVPERGIRFRNFRPPKFQRHPHKFTLHPTRWLLLGTRPGQSSRNAHLSFPTSAAKLSRCI
jgi:hypothetical protein